MTVSRSFAPPPELQGERDPGARDDAAVHNAAVAPPVFPLLPYACTAYAEHCTRDYADYMDKLVHAEEPWIAEMHMLNDMNQAFLSLVWAPFDAAMSQVRR